MRTAVPRAPGAVGSAGVDTVDLRRVVGPALPLRLAGLQRGRRPGDQLDVRLPGPRVVDPGRLADVVVGAGFTPIDAGPLRLRLRRERTLPDTVGPGMRLLVIGLNPSPAAADAGVGFARPGNRFWPAALAAGVVSIDRDPVHALEHHGVGMTDVVKRTTRRAADLDAVEYRDGMARVERLVAWLAPAAVCFVGLAGWRSARDRRAVAGWQAEPLAGARVYLMPSTSGINASSRLDDLTDHLREVRSM